MASGVIVAGALGCTSLGGAPPPSHEAQPVTAAPTPEPPPPRATASSVAEAPDDEEPEPDWDLGPAAATLAPPGSPGGAAELPARRAPDLDLGAPAARIMGSISRDLIREGVRAGLDDFAACWEASRAGGSEGGDVRLTVQFTIGPDGGVTGAEAHPLDRDDAELARCVTRVVEGLRFPPTPGGGLVLVCYPFAFRPSPGA